MYLNADILHGRLSRSFHTRIFGPRKPDLLLRRPQLFVGNEDHLLRHHIYVGHSNDLPTDPLIEDGVCIVCVDDNPIPRAFRERCCVINVDGVVSADSHAQSANSASLPEIFNAIQEVFDDFDEWAEDIGLILSGDANIQAILERSLDIFQNPLFVLDANFSLLGAAGFPTGSGGFFTEDSFDGVNLQPAAFQKFMATSDLSMREPEPFFINILDQSTLNLDLLNEDEYLGCLTLCYAYRGHQPADKPLIAELGEYVQRAIERVRQIPDESTSGSLRQALKRLIDSVPLEPVDELALQSTFGRTFMCAYITPSERLDQLPLGYICNTINRGIRRSVVIEYQQSAVVAFIDLDAISQPLTQAFSDTSEIVSDLFMPYVHSLDLRIGLSDPISDLTNALVHERQAQIASQVGALIDPDKSIFFFQRYNLDAMLINAPNGLPLEFVETPGLRRLSEHDAHSETSYIETLQVLLDENMNVTKAASRLFIHRSTLIERLARIKRELHGELDSPRGRLHLSLLLEARNIQRKISGRIHGDE